MLNTQTRFWTNINSIGNDSTSRATPSRLSHYPKSLSTFTDVVLHTSGTRIVHYASCWRPTPRIRSGSGNHREPTPDRPSSSFVAEHAKNNFYLSICHLSSKQLIFIFNPKISQERRGCSAVNLREEPFSPAVAASVGLSFGDALSCQLPSWCRVRRWNDPMIQHIDHHHHHQPWSDWTPCSFLFDLSWFCYLSYIRMWCHRLHAACNAFKNDPIDDDHNDDDGGAAAEDSLESALRCCLRRSPGRDLVGLYYYFFYRVACNESKNKIMFENLTVQLQLRSRGVEWPEREMSSWG